MRRTDRLYDTMEILRDGRLHRAGEIAARLGVSVRTVWRDMATLMASGLPLEGERGVGYILRAPTMLPPLMLNAGELDALRAGLAQVAAGGDEALARAARSLAAKIAAVTPAPSFPDPQGLFALRPGPQSRATRHLPLIRAAIRARERLSVSHIDPLGRESHQDIRPLKTERQGKTWSLLAWCEGRRDFRRFRLDRITALTPTGETFPDEPGRGLADWKAQEAAAG
jgi:predicted DNA-binding transcriptional regulator YafY